MSLESCLEQHGFSSLVQVAVSGNAMTKVLLNGIRRWVLILFLLSVSGATFAQSVDYVWLTTDPDVSDLAEVQQYPEASWQPVGKTGTVNIGFSSQVVWLRVTVPPGQQDQLLSINYPLLDNVQLTWFQGGQKLGHFEVGDRLPFDTRPIPNRNFVFPVPGGSEPATAFIRVDSEGSVEIPVTVKSAIEFFEKEQLSYGWQMVFLGIMVAMALYNLFVLLIVRHSAYLWYVLTVVASALVILNFNGLLFQWLWPDSPTMNRYFTAPVIAANVLFAVMFAIHYLQIRKYSLWSYRVMRMITGLSVAGVVFGLIGSYQASTAFVSILAALVTPIAFVVGLIVWRKGQRLGGFYIAAWTPLLLGHLINSLSKIGLIPASTITDMAPQVGVILEVMLLSFALAYRISLERKRRVKAQDRILEVQRKANQTLEARVQERTEELEIANERLKALTVTDGLTQVANRRRFDEKLESEWRRARRHQHALSIILFDMDHFKKLNDVWGHLAGDDCLVQVAGTCADIIKRTGDLLARYGGEEFVVLLPETPESGAQLVAERLRKAISSLPIETGASDKTISVTISAGVATLVPDEELTAQDLLQRADEALYAAKGAGRNRVMLYRDDSMSEAGVRS